MTGEEIKKFFDGSPPTRYWTTRFARDFGAIVQKANPGRGSRSPQSDAVKVYTKRSKQLQVAIDALTTHAQSEGLTDEERRKVIVRLNDVRKSSRLVTPLAQAYRKEFNSSEPRHSAKNLFMPSLSLYCPYDDSFVHQRRAGFSVLTNVLQIDLMNCLHSAPTILSSLGTKRTGEQAVREKLEGVLSRHLLSTDSRCLQSVHLHVDTPLYVAIQKSKEQRRRDAIREGQQGDMKASEFDWNSLYDLGPKAWMSLLTESRFEKDKLASLHLVSAAILW